MEKLRFCFVVLMLFFATSFVVAQTELMDDVSAVKENSDEDLYPAEDVDPSKSASASSSGAKTGKDPLNPDGVEKNTFVDKGSTGNFLEDLPVTSSGAKPDSALTGNEGSAAELSAIHIYTLPDRVRYEIQTSKVVDYKPENNVSGREFAINLANTNLGPNVSPSPIDSKEYGGPVNNVQAFDSKSGTGTNARIVMNLSSPSEPSIRREGNKIFVDFFTKGGGTLARKGRSARDIPSDFETLISLNGKQNFVGTKVNFRVKDGSVPDVLQFISQVSGKNFVLVGETDKKLSMNVKNVPWDQVLALVLLNAELGYQKLGNTYRVMPVTKIRQEIADSIKASEDEDKLSPKATQLFPLSYAKTSEVIPQISKYLKAEYNENVVSDDRTNSIVVTALPKNIQRIRRYIDAIDKQTPVVQIEARIVQARKDFSRDLGIDWKALGGIQLGGGNLLFGAALGNQKSSSSSSSGATTSVGSATTIDNFITQGGGRGNYQNSSGTLRELDLILKLNESKGVSKELSRPSLTVLNNKKASIIDGTELTLLLSTAESSGDTSGTTKTVKAALSLTVTPQVTNDNNILLNINLTRDSLGAIVLGTLSVAKKEVNTETLVESGATVAIGGVYIKEDAKSEAGWPFIRKIPILGRLFTSTDSTLENERELLMFISPRILNKEKASVMQQTLEEAR
jgi:type IV pilus assembly protein PilQ